MTSCEAQSLGEFNSLSKLNRAQTLWCSTEVLGGQVSMSFEYEQQRQMVVQESSNTMIGIGDER